ncbi:Gfo/Idh/MocA family protein [Paenibacillus cremeus]|uniref:Gfo/Idh/MocA family oxidoreductase n=1 Tax=Paenibacillus cremeus TaxID=2163881 RepID=A0A559KEJ8_9BACL|nr:Gfo/Idh/MocA family oxidoreductase [Paenibacillus cremeus]TVY10549.1 Gfo/Idh/MocA family oxidoreductase [Paenibacillus cremeus]
MIKVGLMGCGVVATYGHIPTIMKNAELELVALFEPDVTRKEQLEAAHEIPVFTDEDAFFEAGFEAVIVTSPAPAHYSNIRAAARYGKHVLCEKPLAMDEQEAEAIIKLMKDSGLMLFTAFDYRFSPVAQTIKSIVDQGAIGEVRSLRLHYVWNCHGKYTDSKVIPLQVNARREGRMLEGGPMVDCGVHQIDLARWWLGSEVTSQHSEGVWVDEYEAPDHMYLHMNHENGAHTLVEISYSYSFTALEPVSHFEYHLIGTEGIIQYNREAKLFEMRNAAGTTVFPFYKEKNFAGMYEEFAQAMASGSTGNMPTGTDGLLATRIARTATDDLLRRRDTIFTL